MVLFPLPSLPLLGTVGQVAASALFGRQDPVVTSFSAVYVGGDASRRRTAESGYEIRLDVTNGAWGFCETKIPDQCDMGGTCIDDSACSAGCGFSNKGLRTWTCSGDRWRYCSTALVTLSDSRVFTNLGCGDKPGRTEQYLAYTTTSKPSTSSPPPAPLPSPQETSRTTTSQPTTSSTSTTQTSTSTPSSTTTSASQASTADAANNLNLNSAPSTAPSTSPSPDPHPPDNTPAIIGAVVGCVALICICVVAVFLIRRSRNTAAAAAAGSGGGTTTGVAEVDGWGGGGAGANDAAELYYKAPPPPSELPTAYYNTGQTVPGTGWAGAYPTVTPVEMPGAGGMTERWGDRLGFR